ncbi:DUF2182 domain-containing protein [Nocardioides ginsengisoli]|uniref:DUF2182 domain-containing protein n=1 Tax=Nocardioides ginsengisoli TaxID=363868 RepID=A0ABW3W3W4_9ACTN
MSHRESVGAGRSGRSALTDTPTAAYRVLETRATLAATGTLVLLGALAWVWTALANRGMDDMSVGLAPGGAMMAMSFDMSIGVFLGMWTAMMVAMMLPTVGPIVLLHRMVTRRRGEGPLASVGLVAGYLAVWVAAGVVPYAFLAAVRDVPRDDGWLVPFGGAVLIVAGGYQFTAWKDACQRACRTPLSFVMTHDFGTGPLQAARVGVTHGLYCVGCCWALMAVLVVVGLTNLAWMAGIALIFLAEKHWRHAVALSRVAGTALIALGVAILIEPSLLGSIAG